MNSPETWGSIEFNPPNKCMEHRRARIFQNWPEFYVCSESDFFYSQEVVANIKLHITVPIQV